MLRSQIGDLYALITVVTLTTGPTSSPVTPLLATVLAIHTPAIPRVGVNDTRLIYKAISSSAGRTRTYNQWINSPLLYQLSYRGRAAGWHGQSTSPDSSTQSQPEYRSCEDPWPLS
jgi:hypothetical protein